MTLHTLLFSYKQVDLIKKEAEQKTYVTSNIGSNGLTVIVEVR